MHAVSKLIHNRLAGTSDNFKLAVVTEDSGQRWTAIGGMLSLLEEYNLKADVVGGASGGGITALYYAAGITQYGVTAHRHLSSLGYDRNGKGKRFINPLRGLVGRPMMDVDGLIDDIFTKRVVMPWDYFKQTEQVVFLTATTAAGLPTTLHLNGADEAKAKAAMKASARIPYIAGNLKAHTLWDGGLTNGLPIQDALDAGATHVLVLRSHSLGAEDHLSGAERYLLRPVLKQRDPTLYQLLLQRQAYKQRIVERFQHDERVLMLQLPHVQTSSTTTNGRLLFHALLDGWNYMAKALNLPPKAYPALWQPDLNEHGDSPLVPEAHR